MKILLALIFMTGHTMAIKIDLYEKTERKRLGVCFLILNKIIDIEYNMRG